MDNIKFTGAGHIEFNIPSSTGSITISSGQTVHLELTDKDRRVVRSLRKLGLVLIEEPVEVKTESEDTVSEDAVSEEPAEDSVSEPEDDVEDEETEAEKEKKVVKKVPVKDLKK